MALLQYRAPVNYEAQIEAFRDFLQNFKASASASEESAANAIDGLQLDDGASDEYDFMDDVEGQGQNGARRRGGQSHRDKQKYMAVLQDIADRVKTNITIELDDLDLVGSFSDNIARAKSAV